MVLLILPDIMQDIPATLWRLAVHYEQALAIWHASLLTLLM